MALDSKLRNECKHCTGINNVQWNNVKVYDSLHKPTVTLAGKDGPITTKCRLIDQTDDHHEEQHADFIDPWLLNQNENYDGIAFMRRCQELKKNQSKLNHSNSI